MCAHLKATNWNYLKAGFLKSTLDWPANNPKNSNPDPGFILETLALNKTESIQSYEKLAWNQSLT